MFQRLVRSYAKIRYFPRLVIRMLTDLSVEVARLQTPIDKAVPAFDVHGEISSFCDDATRHMIKWNAASADQSARLAALQHMMQRLEHTMQLAESGLRRSIEELQADVLRLRTSLHDGGMPDHGSEAQPVETSAASGHADHGWTRQSARLVEELRLQTREIKRIERVTSQQVRLFPSLLWSPEDSSRVREILALLRPVGVRGVDKIRVGRDHDGGYVMLDDFASIGGALSLGIADDVSWDADVAGRGIEVFQYDPSISEPPAQHPRFHFESLRVVPQGAEGGISIETIVNQRIGGAASDLMLLKIDIESSEWDVFDSMDDNTLPRFKQIVCEFHDLDRLAERDFGHRAREVFAKLAKYHAVVHVHGNNCGNFANVGNVVVPQALEVTFALTSAYEFTDPPLCFPTALDQPNQPGRADLFLGQFQF